MLAMDDVPKVVSFDEFRLYYDSTERVTDRRLETNRWNYSTSVAILLAIAAIVRWGVTSAEFRWVSVGAVVFLSLMAILFCQLWLAQIRDFKRLNDAKFEVLNRMAPLLDFDTDHPGRVQSYCPFQREWDRLKDEGAVDRVRKINVIALKSSHMEQFIPRAFQLVFAAAVAALIVILLIPPSLPTFAPTKAVPNQG